MVSEMKAQDKSIREFLIERLNGTSTIAELDKLCKEISEALESGYIKLSEEEDEIESEYYKELAEVLRDSRNGI